MSRFRKELVGWLVFMGLIFLGIFVRLMIQPDLSRPL